MRRRPAVAALLCASIALGGCAGGAPAASSEASASPEWVDLGAAAGVGAGGNGLWLQEGAVAAGRVIEAAQAGGSVQFTARLRELVVREGEQPAPGRTVEASRTGTPDRYRATLVIGAPGIDAGGSTGEYRAEAVVLDATAWVRGNEAFAANYGLDGPERFVCVARSSRALRDIEAFTDPAAFLRTALTGAAIGAIPPATGEATMQLAIGAEGAPTGRLDVSAVGAPLPLRLLSADATGEVSAEFSWGAGDEVTRPADAPDCD